MSKPTHNDNAMQIITLLAELHYTMTNNGELAVIHVPGEGDQTFFVNQEQGEHATRHILQWLQSRKVESEKA